MKGPRLALLFVAAMLGHWWWTTHLSRWGLAPQWLLVLTVAAAARLGPIGGMGLGFFWGLFLDAFNARLFGANALALTLAAYGTGSARRQIEVADLAPQCLLVFLMTWAYFLFMGGLAAVFSRHFLWPGWAAFLLDPFCNCLAAAAVFPLWPSRRER